MKGVHPWTQPKCPAMRYAGDAVVSRGVLGAIAGTQYKFPTGRDMQWYIDNGYLETIP